MYAVLSKSVVINNLFINNVATMQGGSTELDAGAIFLNRPSGVVLTNNSFSSCVSNSTEGAIVINTTRNTTLGGNTFTGNSALSGGSIDSTPSYNTTIVGNVFTGNQAQEGAAIYSNDMMIKFQSNLVHLNVLLPPSYWPAVVLNPFNATSSVYSIGNNTIANSTLPPDTMETEIVLLPSEF